jgi:hypothetical protein
MNSRAEIEQIILKLANLTLQCVDKLNIISYEELQQFLLIRESLILELQRMEIPSEVGASFRDQVAEILKHDEAILAKMNSFKESAGIQVARMTASRKQKDAYQSQYSESYFFDKKK